MGWGPTPVKELTTSPVRRKYSESMKSPQLALFEPPACAPTLREVADAVRVAGIDGLPEARERADHARYQEVHVRSAMTRSQGMPFKWALNPYRGCTHACEYCYARKYQRHLELGAGDDFSSLIFVKTQPARRAAARAGAAGLGARDRRRRDRDRSLSADRRTLQADTALSRGAGARSRRRSPSSPRARWWCATPTCSSRASRAAGCQVYLSVPSVDEAGVGDARAGHRAAAPAAPRGTAAVGRRGRCRRADDAARAGRDDFALRGRAPRSRPLRTPASASRGRASRTSKTACASTSSRFWNGRIPICSRAIGDSTSDRTRRRTTSPKSKRW